MMTSVPPSSPATREVSVLPRHTALGLAALAALLAIAAAFLPSLGGRPASVEIVSWIDPLLLDSGTVMRSATGGDRALRSYLLTGREDAAYEVSSSATRESLKQLRATARLGDEETRKLADSFAVKTESWLEFADELAAKSKNEGIEAGKLALETGVGTNRLELTRSAFEALDKRLRSLRDEQLRLDGAAASRARLLSLAALVAAAAAAAVALVLGIRAGRPVVVPVQPLDPVLLRAVIEPLEEGVVVFGGDGHPLASNAAASRLAAADEGSAPALLRAEGEPLESDGGPAAAALRGEVVSDCRLLAQSAEGALTPVSVSAAPVTRDDGSVIVAVLALRSRASQERLAADLAGAALRVETVERELAKSETEATAARKEAAAAAARAAELETRAAVLEASSVSDAHVSDVVQAAHAVGIAVFDAREFRLLAANETGLRLLGERRRERDARGSSLVEIVPGAETNGLAKAFRQVALSAQAHVVEEAEIGGLRHGVAYWHYSVAPLIGPSGMVERLMLAGVDVTPFVETRRAVDTTRHEAEVEQSHRVEDVLVAVSNNLRTPVTSIRGMVGIFRDKYCEGIPDVTALHFLELTQRNAEQMAMLVEDMAELSALGRQPLGFAEVPLAAVVEEAWQASPRPGLELRIAGPLPIVRADRARLSRAIKDVFDVAGQLKAEATSFVHVRARDLGTKWEIEIADNGRGFDPHAAESLFGPLAAYDGTSNGANGSGSVLGVGIGLAATRRIAQLHGGDARATGEVGKGATYSITIEK